MERRGAGRKFGLRLRGEVVERMSKDSVHIKLNRILVYSKYLSMTYYITSTTISLAFEYHYNTENYWSH